MCASVFWCLEGTISLVFFMPYHFYNLSSSSSTVLSEPLREGFDSISFRTKCSKVSLSAHCLVMGRCISSYLLKEDDGSETLIYGYSGMQRTEILQISFWLS